jgi:hypothetical protein
MEENLKWCRQLQRSLKRKQGERQGASTSNKEKCESQVSICEASLSLSLSLSHSLTLVESIAGEEKNDGAHSFRVRVQVTHAPFFQKPFFCKRK